METIEQLIERLNPMQKKAVLTTEGPLLLLAGAGSGKTRVLTHRIAYLIEKGVRPFNILAITFTNKAAREMKERVAAITEKGDEVWVSTFHSTCVKLLRREIDKIGYSNRFSIYDSDDSERLIKLVLKELNIDDKRFPPRNILSEIGNSKDNLISAEEYADTAINGDFFKKTYARIYTEYQNKLRENNALDFDDLIFMTVELFRKCPEILEKYQDRFQYIMVDEYQDTNASQYQLIKLLSAKHHNLCVVGDDDQSIYGWRGADIKNILNFENDFKNTSVIKLEQNYRYTNVILDAANEVIKHNYTRKDKKLWTDVDGGDKIIYCQCYNDFKEAEYVCEQIKKGVEKGKKYQDFAILYRNNSLSRIMEEILIRQGIPYRLFGGTRFYDRKEIRDILGYLKAINNPNDDLPIRRIINVPKRGIGDTSIGRVSQYAIDNNMSFYEALSNVENIDTLSPKAKKSISDFVRLIEDLRNCAETMSASEILDKILAVTLYIEELRIERTEQANGRIENIHELLNKAAQFEDQNPDDASVSAFLEDVALVADVDAFTEDQDTTVLMTLHSAKGLEFDTVFIIGFEEGIFPSYMSTQSANMNAMEEERRLCYVGITRAKKQLYLTTAKSRMHNGKHVSNLTSRFLKEIPTADYENAFQGVEIKNKAKGNIEETPQPQIIRPNFRKRPVNNYKMPVPQDYNPDFEVGDKVRHFKFGIGQVIDICAAGADYEVTVDFDMPQYGKKKLMAKLSKLKKL